jgi:thiol-disulfide isomerase/thioredoxin
MKKFDNQFDQGHPMNLAKFILIPLIAFIGFFCSSIELNAAASPPSNKSKVTIHFFWGDGCEHCMKAKPFLKNLASKYPQIELKMYEIWYNQENQKLFYAMGKEHGIIPEIVPATYIGKEYFSGFNDRVANQIEISVQKNLEPNSDKLR